MTDRRPIPSWLQVGTKLIRLCCDGETTPQQAAEWEQYLQTHPEDRDAIVRQLEQERHMREHVGVVMQSCPAAPARLRDAIGAACSQPDCGLGTASAADVAGRIGAASARVEPKRRWSLVAALTETRRANVVAIAATLALIAGAVLFGIFGRSIDDIPAASAADLLSTAAAYADQEHSVCAGDGLGLKQRIEAESPAEASRALTDWLAVPVSVFDLTGAGYEFVGAGRCDMPLPARSGHLVYRKSGIEPGRPTPMLSVFIIPDHCGCTNGCGGRLCEGLDEGKWCCVNGQKVKRTHRVLRATDGRLVYFLVCCSDRDLDVAAQRIQLAAAGSTAP